jgi:hypothetical protein
MGPNGESAGGGGAGAVRPRTVMTIAINAFTSLSVPFPRRRESPRSA